MTKRKGKKKSKQQEIEDDEQAAIKIEISKLKKKKAVLKSLFTRTRHQLIQLLGEDELPSKEEIRGLQTKLTKQQQEVIELMIELLNQNEKMEERKNDEQISEEIETINREYADTMDQVNGYILSNKGDGSCIGTRVSSRMSQLYDSEAIAREKAKRIENEVKMKQEMLRRARQQLEEKYKAEKSQLEQQWADQERRMETSNQVMQRCHQWLEKGINNELGMDQVEEDHTDLEEDSTNLEKGNKDVEETTNIQSQVNSKEKRHQRTLMRNLQRLDKTYGNS